MAGRGTHMAVPGGMNRAQKHPPHKSWFRGGSMGAGSGSSPFSPALHCESPWPVSLSVHITPRWFTVCLQFPAAWLVLSAVI